MLTLTTRHQYLIAIAVAVVMIATRGHHFATSIHLPDASWALFFMAGLYLRPIWIFPSLLALAGLIDYVAITWGGVSSFCVSGAYAMLLPAYGALWLAGRWYAKRYRFEWSTLMPLTLTTFTGAALCELISSGSFYFFSGRFTDTNMAEFGARLVKYFPGSLQGVLFYIAITTITHAVFVLSRNTIVKDNTTEG